MTPLETVVQEAKRLSAAVVAGKSSEDGEAPLKELHEILFDSDHLAADRKTPEALRAHVQQLISEIDLNKTKARGGARKAIRGGVDKDLVVLEAVLLLADILLSAASESEPVGQGSPRYLRRLETLVLPTLFATRSVPPVLLRDVGLKLPWSLYTARAGRCTEAAPFLNSAVVDFLQSVRVNYHCDLLPPTSHSVGDHRGDCVSTPVEDAEDTCTDDSTLRSSGCISWEAALRQPAERKPGGPTAQRRGEGLGVVRNREHHGIPSYLITKRPPSSAWASKASAAASVPAALATHEATSQPFVGGTRRESALFTNLPSDSEDSNSIPLALATPVKRRRIDPSLHVPPSPERPTIE